MARLRLFVQLGVALLMSVLALGGPLGAQANPGTVTITKHADLGFTTSVPVDVDTGVASPPCLLSFVGCLFHGAVAFHGTLKVDVTLGTDVALTIRPWWT